MFAVGSRGSPSRDYIQSSAPHISHGAKGRRRGEAGDPFVLNPMMRKFQTWTTKRRAIIILPTGVDTSQQPGEYRCLGQQIYEHVDEKRHEVCRRSSRRLFGIILILGAINVYLCAVILFALPALD